ncbi:hypothetical protein TIFTF001_044627 [Ficus carica]|uniref:Secreted protein n=1 Tax=Ficus carica TaxID=3494 RepID=A0AA87ZSS4_FICCA|nr:hypothetical protein TIFTF001_044627 [Ficus carica]
MWWSAILALASQVSKARSMTCPFLVMAGHMCRVMVVLASQLSKATKLTHQSLRNQGGGRPCGAYVERHGLF